MARLAPAAVDCPAGRARAEIPDLDKRVERARRRAALPRLPEPDARRFQRAARGRPAQPDPRAARRRARASARCCDFMVARYGDFVLYRPPLKAEHRGCCGSGRSCFWRSASGSCCAAWRRRRVAAARSCPTPSARAPPSCSNDRCSGWPAPRWPRWRLRSCCGRCCSRTRAAARFAARGQHLHLPRPAARARRRPRRRHARAGRLRARARRARGAPAGGRAPRRPSAAPARRAARWPRCARGCDPAAGARRLLRRRQPARWSTRRSSARRPPAVEAMVARLAARLRENPDDAEGWKLLGRSYAALGRFHEAADATPRRRRARRATRAARRFRRRARDGARPEPGGRAREAGAARARDRPAATSRRWRSPAPPRSGAGTTAAPPRYWERMLPLVPADSEDARSIQANIDEAKSRVAARRAAARHGLAVARSSRASVARRHACSSSRAPPRARRCRSPSLRKRVRDLPCELRARRLDGDGARHAQLSVVPARGGRRRARLEVRQRHAAARRPAGRERAGRQRSARRHAW